MSYFPHAFDGRIVHHNLGSYRYTVVFLPEDLAAELPFDGQPRLRARGEIDDFPFHGAWQPAQGRHYLMISKEILRQGGYAVGDWVSVRFRIEDAEAVDLPEILEGALAEDHALRALWEQTPAGKRRGLAYYVSSAKQPKTQQKRLAELVADLRGERSIFRQRDRARKPRTTSKATE